MISSENFKQNINDFNGCYIFSGYDEELIKNNINMLSNEFKSLYGDLDLNIFDGIDLSLDTLMETCDILPLIASKRLVIINRANNFIDNQGAASNISSFNLLKKYIKDFPQNTILIMCYVIDNKRDTIKKNSKIKSLDKLVNVITFELSNKKTFDFAKTLFQQENYPIGDFELQYFLNTVPQNIAIIKNEVQKLINFCNGRSISQNDINLLQTQNNTEDDVFDLIDLISKKEINKAIALLNELLIKSDQHILVIISIENQFKKLFSIKNMLKNGANIEDISVFLKLPQFICKKLLNLSDKFSLEQLENILIQSVEVEKKLKHNCDKKAVLELFLVNILFI